MFVSLYVSVCTQDINYPSTVPSSLSFTEHPGGTIIDDKLIFTRARSPYWLRNDIVVERNAEMIVEPGVTIRVEPQIGITVRGVLTAMVSNLFYNDFNTTKIIQYTARVELYVIFI